MLAAARVVDMAADRTSLLATAVATIDREQGRPSRRLGGGDARGCGGRHARGAAPRPFVPAAHRANDGGRRTSARGRADVRGLERLLLSDSTPRRGARRAAGPTRSTRSWPRSRRSSTRRGSFSWRAIAGRCARRSCAATASRSARRSTCSRELKPPLEDIKSLAGLAAGRAGVHPAPRRADSEARLRRSLLPRRSPPPTRCSSAPRSSPATPRRFDVKPCSPAT